MNQQKKIIIIIMIIMIITYNCYRLASPADPFQMFRDSMEVRWILDRVSQSVDASKTSGD